MERKGKVMGLWREEREGGERQDLWVRERVEGKMEERKLWVCNI